MKFTKWIKTLLHIVKTYEETKSNQYQRFAELERILRERTEISVDISPSRKGVNNIIVLGRYRNADFIQTYNIYGDNIDYLINLLREMERTAAVRRIDGPPVFREVFSRKDYYENG